MRQKMLVSVIVPCYNQAHFLSDALNSVINQSYPYWECIIVNDGSVDETDKVAQIWIMKDERFKYITKENGGLSSARNAGLSLADGDYIQLLDADDLLEENKLKHQTSYFNKYGGKIDIVVSGYRYFRDSDEERELFIFGPYDLLPEVALNQGDKKDLIKLFAKTNPMVVSAPLYRKSVFEKVGRFDESLGANEDWDFHFRCALNNMVFQHSGYPPDTKTLIRIHDANMSVDKGYMMENLDKFRQKHKDNEVFALANNIVKDDSIIRYLKLVKWIIPPIFAWLIRRFMKFIKFSLR